MYIEPFPFAVRLEDYTLYISYLETNDLTFKLKESTECEKKSKNRKSLLFQQEILGKGSITPVEGDFRSNRVS